MTLLIQITSSPWRLPLGPMKCRNKPPQPTNQIKLRVQRCTCQHPVRKTRNQKKNWWNQRHKRNQRNGYLTKWMTLNALSKRKTPSHASVAAHTFQGLDDGARYANPWWDQDVGRHRAGTQSTNVATPVLWPNSKRSFQTSRRFRKQGPDRC